MYTGITETCKSLIEYYTMCSKHIYIYIIKCFAVNLIQINKFSFSFNFINIEINYLNIAN